MTKITGSAFDQLLVHSMKRLNDKTTGTFARIVGAGTKLYLASNPVAIDSGYSGNPLSMIQFRPEQSPRPWVYVADSLRMRKVLVDGTNYQVGIAPPTLPATAQIGGIQFAILNLLSLATQWTAYGGGSGIAVTSSNFTATKIVYDFGTSGLASIVFTPTTGLLNGDLLLDGSIPVYVQFVNPTPSSTTIGSIVYDSGTTGLCTITTGSNVAVLAPNSVYLLNSGGGNQEYVQVISAQNSYPNGTATIRCSTVNTHVATETMTGEASFRTVVPAGVNNGDTLVLNYISEAVALVGGGGTDVVSGLTITNPGGGYPSAPPLTITGDGSGATGTCGVIPIQQGGRIVATYVTNPGAGYSHATCAVGNVGSGTGGQITPVLTSGGGVGNSSGGMLTFTPAATETVGTRDVQSTDTINLTFQADVPANIASLTVIFNLDPNVIDFATNALVWTIPNGSFGSGGSWIQLSTTVGSLTRLGTNFDLGFNTGVNGIKFLFGLTASVNVKYRGFTISGSYGPNVVSPEGPILYQYVYRSSFTGATSNPSPIMREGLNPTGSSVLVQGTPSPDPQVDLIDFYRFGASLTEYYYVGTGPNSSATFVDDFDDPSIATNPTLETDNFQPFPTIDIPKKGTVNVSGFNVTWVSGAQFNVNWYQGSEIVINGQVYNLYTEPTSATALQILQNGGSQSAVPFQINQATILAQPLPFLWGPYQQGTGLFCFACGDTYQPGVLFLTNGNNPDAASDVLQLEITTPSEPLVNGCMYTGNSYVWSTGRMFSLYPSFGSGLVVEAGTLIPAEGTNPFVPIEVPNGKGLFCPWCLAVGPKIWFRAADGIYETVGGAPESITTAELALLFPHDNQPGQPVTVGTFTVYPPDDTLPALQKFSYYNSFLYYDYQDTQGNKTTLVWSEVTKAWTKDDYTPQVASHYGEEGQGVNSMLLGGVDGNIYQAAGSTDGSGAAFPFEARMPQMSELVGGYQQPRDCFLGLMDSAAANLVINVDGADNVIALPVLTGNYKRIYQPLPPVKGKLLAFALLGSSPFLGLFQRDCEFRAKTWGDQQYSKINPFSGLGRAAAGKVE